MTRFAKKMTPVLSVVILGSASLAFAGATNDSAYCYKNPDGSGGCHGNLLGFRNHEGSGTYAYFYKSNGGSKYFYGGYTNTSTGTTTYGSCSPDATLSAMWNRALAHEGYFSIKWDSSGTCDYLLMNNGSQYSSF